MFLRIIRMLKILCCKLSVIQSELVDFISENKTQWRNWTRIFYGKSLSCKNIHLSQTNGLNLEAVDSSINITLPLSASCQWRHFNDALTRKPSLEVALTTSATLSADVNFFSACYLFIVYISGVLLQLMVLAIRLQCFVTDFPIFTFSFSQRNIFLIWPWTVTL